MSVGQTVCSPVEHDCCYFSKYCHSVTILRVLSSLCGWDRNGWYLRQALGLRCCVVCRTAAAPGYPTGQRSSRLHNDVTAALISRVLSSLSLCRCQHPGGLSSSPSPSSNCANQATSTTCGTSGGKAAASTRAGSAGVPCSRRPWAGCSSRWPSASRWGCWPPWPSCPTRADAPRDTPR